MTRNHLQTAKQSIGTLLISGMSLLLVASPAFAAVTLSDNIANTGTYTGTSASANALTVGLAGATNPAFQVDASTASSATGLKVKSAAAAAGVALSVVSSGTNEALTIDAKGSGTIGIGATSTGAVTITPATAITGALTANGAVTLGDAAADIVTVSGTIAGASPLVFEGATADAFELTIGITDPTAASTWTVPNFAVNAAFVGSTLTTNNIDAANSVWAVSNGLVLEGATANGFELTLSPADSTADATLTLPDFTGSGALLASSLTTNNIDAANSVWAVSNGLVLEGATADGFEATLSLTDPTADRALNLPNAAGTVLLSTADQDAANSIKGVANGFELEGATADTFEVTLTLTDPTADATWTVPNFAVNAAFVGSTLTTNNIDAANSVWAVSNGLVLEGVTADGFEITLSPADATADATWTVPNFAVNAAFVGSTLTTNNIDAANSVWAVSNGLVLEGATADGFEATLSLTDPTADRALNLPNAAGTVLLSTADQDAANSIKGVANGFELEGATADTFEVTLTLTDPTADATWTVPNFAVNAAFVGSTLTTNNIDAANSVWAVSNGLVLEGATADGFEATLSLTDPTADRALNLPNAAGTVLLSTADQDAANSIKGVANGFELEGATADTFEVTLTLTDPTADATWTVPNFAVNAAFVGSTLTTNNIDAANSVWAVSNGLVLEGVTADGFEITLSPADATADATWTVPNFAVNAAFVGSTLTTNNIDAANSVWAVSNGLVLEGAT